MATMATTHGLSVLTNASIKPPRNPKTGLSTSLHERQSPTIGRLSGIFYDDYDDERERSKEILGTKSKFTTTADPATVMQLSSLTDEEFYDKLLELKNEQRKILQKCEKVYINKCNPKIAPTFSDDDGDNLRASIPASAKQSFRSETFVDDDGVLVSVKRSRSPKSPERVASPVSHERGMTPPPFETQTEEVLIESTKKPPTGRPPVPFMSKSINSPPSRPQSAPIPRQDAWSRSVEDLRRTVAELHRSFEESDDDFVPDDTVSEPYKPRDITKTMSRVEDMWDNFVIDDYAPRKSRTERISSATVTRKERSQREIEKTESWRHRLTIPQPFSMTLREEGKEKKKSKVQKEFEEEMLRKQKEEEEECNKKFKARPVPAHVYLPLFDEIQEEKEQKRRHIRSMSAELLKSQEKPFSFLKREEDRKKHLTMERECNNKVKKSQPVPSNTFCARPVPKAIFDSSVDDKILEEEEYRKIRMKMRAEELLRSASLPPNMDAREKLKEQIEREKKMKMKKKVHRSSSRTKINHEVPNYDALYRQFQTELQRRKGQREGTVTQPFRLTPDPKKIEKIKQDIQRDEETLKENRWPYKMSRSKPKNLGHMSSSLDALPAKSTRSADVRNSKTRNRLQELSQREIREIEDDRRRRVKEIRLRRSIQEKIHSKETPRETPSEKKQKFREAERSRMEEYEKELDDMKERVNRRPLLFEQESQTNARKKAEKKFNATLRSVGLDEDFIESRGSRSASVHDYTDYDDDDFEDTNGKRHQDETYTKRYDSDRSLSPMEA